MQRRGSNEGDLRSGAKCSPILLDSASATCHAWGRSRSPVCRLGAPSTAAQAEALVERSLSDEEMESRLLALHARGAGPKPLAPLSDTENL